MNKSLCHRLRTLLGGELGNEAADEIERLANENATLWMAFDNTTLPVVVPAKITIETVSKWLGENGLTAVTAADAERIAKSNPTNGNCICKCIGV